ncbi:MAG: hypothetical protein HFJ53_00235 [Clostridia bacterium]|jgi:hypothetical protein|nr:hypothetical protein [Clostridia bacterium]
MRKNDEEILTPCNGKITDLTRTTNSYNRSLNSTQARTEEKIVAFINYMSYRNKGLTEAKQKEEVEEILRNDQIEYVVEEATKENTTEENFKDRLKVENLDPLIIDIEKFKSQKAEEKEAEEKEA